MTGAPEFVSFIGYGEAAQAFVEGWGTLRPGAILAYDIAIHDPALSPSKRAEIDRDAVQVAESSAQATRAADAILSLVTADQALAAAQTAAAALAPGALYCDLNSVAPDTKRAAARVIEAAGGRYVDVAVMSPVRPALAAAPLLVSGPHADAGVAALIAMGFSSVRAMGAEVGRASSIKMIRSVMVKGIEALTAECVLAAEAAGVTAEVLGSLGGDWPAKADYNLDRMMVHGLRRAAEMEEVVKTLDALGTGSVMTRGTVQRQRAIGAIGIKHPPQGLAAKTDALNERKAKAA